MLVMFPLLFWMINSFENTSDEVHKVKETIPESEWTGLALAMHLLLPIAGLALIWGQRGIFSKLLLQLDRSCVSVYCPSLSKREKLLKWASARLPLTWSSQARTLSSGIPELWKDGSLLCTLINSVVPGACPNPHRHWRKPPTHAQALAYKYLGLTPVFSSEELSGEFTINQERNFIHYLNELQQAINKWATNNEITNRKFSSQYVARGMGLYTGEQYRKTVFYIYSDAATPKKRSNVLMYVRGPYGTKGKATIPPFHSLKTIPVVNVLQDQLEATKVLPFKNNEQKSFLKTISLDFTSLLNVEDNNNQIQDDIPIQIDMEIDRAKVTYIPNNTGIYEITLISDGELLRGFPYSVRVIPSTTEKKDSFNIQEESIETNEKITFTKRKVLSKVIDCIDEQIVIDAESNSSKIHPSKKDKDLTITAISRRDDEILKTEINCTLEDIVEEIVAADQDSKSKAALDSIQHETNKENNNNIVSIEEISKIAEEFDGKTNKTDWKIDSNTKIVKNLKQAKDEIICSIQEQQPSQTSNSKLIKDMVNNSRLENKQRQPLKRITSKIYLEIAPFSQNNSSPICPDHIAPEEKTPLKELSLAEKRKIFAKQDSIESCYSSFSEQTENEQESNQSGESNFQELSVLNLLETLKQSRRDSDDVPEPYSLSSTISLPNMSSLETMNFQQSFGTVKARRDYWERMSSKSSSSLSINSDSLKSKKLIHKNLFNKLDELNDSTKVNKYSDYNGNTSSHNSITEKKFFKSSNDICLIPYEATPGSFKKFKSYDDSLEDCSVLTIEQRKKILLKDSYEKEKQITATKLHFNNDLRVTKFTPSPTVGVVVAKSVNSSQDGNEVEKAEIIIKKTKSTITTQFKRALKIFKNLENTTKIKETNKVKAKEDLKRRYSLDSPTKSKSNLKKNRNNKGGSLNLPNISERFSINNLYKDVFGNKKDSFRGTPNKIGVNKSLASLTNNNNNNKTSNTKNNEMEDDNIKYNLFLNKSKTKQRKSIRTLFEVHY